MSSRFFISLTAAMLACQSFAGTLGTDLPVKNWSWVGSIEGGFGWARVGETQTFFLAPEVIKTYAARKPSNALPFGELFLGVQKNFSPVWQAQLGLAGAITGNATLQGMIWDDADPQFDNYIYKYKERNSRVAVKGKLLFDNGYWFTPWASASFGVGFNRSFDFINTPLIFEVFPDNNFKDNTTTTYTYTLGGGVQKSLNDHWQVGIGYEFADWGKSKLDNAVGQTVNTGLKLNHLYTNGVLLNLSYVS